MSWPAHRPIPTRIQCLTGTIRTPSSQLVPTRTAAIAWKTLHRVTRPSVTVDGRRTGAFPQLYGSSARAPDADLIARDERRVRNVPRPTIAAMS